MGRINLDDYVEVKDRIKMLYIDHPDCRIETHIQHLDFERDPAVCVIKASIYITAEEATPKTTGLAYEEQIGPINKGSFVENAETSAIGRALANMNYQGNAQRPSREEMASVKDHQNGLDTLSEQLKEVITEGKEAGVDERLLTGATQLVNSQDNVERMTRAITFISQEIEKNNAEA